MRPKTIIMLRFAGVDSRPGLCFEVHSTEKSGSLGTLVWFGLKTVSL